MMDHAEAHHLALDLVKKAGFVLSTASSRSEACYYYHPARAPLLLRIATHSSKRAPMGLQGRIIAKATFSSRDTHPFSEAHVENVVAMAIGRYFITDPRPSEYKGKRGTWEHGEATTR